MKDSYFIEKETLAEGERLELSSLLASLNFNSDGLIPVITQDADDKQVLMMAWMNADTLEKTLHTGLMTYWSRSRQAEWIKGKSSGHWQQLVSMRIDCDGDTILCQVNQTGAACHTGRRHCFYFKVSAEQQEVVINSGLS
ncbi:phosphoribosyl-AMP cyclohydrolase [Pseudoteredinibacter isoporae]|nr:phosphoribosyl-AMP cyclohydrolase [Pseudoteredinibacter isoporae]NHO87776.1 phosphoribosyl-AMP cyclohydrolase [Pseudoteredinibacter isoporae]NIB23893.1 phosphoribosyl-AMP cyclohydrolase [Pseudoteredinibacter isoporae]